MSALTRRLGELNEADRFRLLCRLALSHPDTVARNLEYVETHRPEDALLAYQITPEQERASSVPPPLSSVLGILAGGVPGCVPGAPGACQGPCQGPCQ